MTFSLEGTELWEMDELEGSDWLSSSSSYGNYFNPNFGICFLAQFLPKAFLRFVPLRQSEKGQNPTNGL